MSEANVSEKIESALLPDEWERALVDSDNGKSDFLDIQYGFFAGKEKVFLPPRDSSPHALAALALYGQPFGFTPEMLDGLNAVLRAMAAELDRQEVTMSGVVTVKLPVHCREDLAAVIDRIEALLPPEENRDG